MVGKAKEHIHLEHYKGLQTTPVGLPTHSRFQSPEIEVEQRSLQIYDQLEGGDLT